jgi:hypothetical protein
MKPYPVNHRLRDDPLEDEMDQMFCDICTTLCILHDQPCECCWIQETES